MASCLFHHAQGLETLQVELLARHIELFEGFLARGVGSEIAHGVFSCMRFFHFKGQQSCFGIGFTFLLLQPVGLNEVIADAAEGEHLFFAQLGEEHFAAPPQNAGQHANLSRLFGRHEIALHVAWCCQGLLFLQAVHPPVGQRPVAEGNVGKACRGYFEVLVVGHHQIFHDAFRSPHDVHRIGSLIGGNAEEVARRKLLEQVHEPFGLDVVVFDKRLHRVAVFL